MCSSDGLRPSRYCVFVPSPTGQSTLVYNTLHRSSAVVAREIASEGGFTSVGHLSEDDSHALAQEGFIVPAGHDEGAELTAILERERRSAESLHLMVLPTLGCNLACRYCFQTGFPSLDHMSLEQADTLASWARDRLQSTQAEEIRLTLFGGEPLCNRRTCHYLCRRIHAAFEQLAIVPRYMIGTNGTLIGEQDLKLFSELEFQCVQVSLDGPEAVHERRRPARNGRPTYRKIRQSLREIGRRCQLSLVISFDKDNVNSLLPLLDELREEPYADDVLLAFNPILPARHPTHHCNRFTMSSEEQALWLEQLYSRAWELGFRRTRVFEQRDPLCMANTENSFVVAPDGRMYKCGALIGRRDFEVGRIENTGLSERHEELMEVTSWQLCPGCAYVPLCGGGCRFMAFEQGGGYDQKFCDKPFFEGFVRAMLRLYFDEEFRRFEAGLVEG